MNRTYYFFYLYFFLFCFIAALKLLCCFFILWYESEIKKEKKTFNDIWICILYFDWLIRHLTDYLAGFVEERGIRQQEINIKMVIEKCKEHNIPFYLCFLDYTKAFDCINYTQLWQTMEIRNCCMDICGFNKIGSHRKSC